MSSNDATSVKNDPVNPNHYKALGNYSAIHVIEAWNLGYHLGQVLKYVQRAGKKNGETTLQDLEKAFWYFQRYMHKLAPEKYDDPAK